MSKREAYLYVEDIRDSVKKIEEYAENLTFADFLKDRKTMNILALTKRFYGRR